MVFVLHERVAQFLADGNVEELDKFLMTSLMGSRTNPDLPRSNNILTLIDRMNNSIDGVRSTYDALCESTHPNWVGTMGSFGKIDREQFELKLGSYDKTNGFSVGVNALLGALMTFEKCYNELADLTYGLNAYFEARELDDV